MPQILGKLWPNGEFSIYTQREYIPEPTIVRASIATSGPEDGQIVLEYEQEGLTGARERMGLSKDSNFDKADLKSTERPRYGAKGLSSKAKRKVRNASFILQESLPSVRYCTFATCTIPSDLGKTEIEKLCRNWNKVVDSYMREIRRKLKRSGLSGQIVGVSEIQKNRYENEKFPALHLHSVFQGRSRGGDWSITPREHDDIWRRAIEAGIGMRIESVKSACNMQSVRKSVGGYISKYIAKGTELLESAIESGLGEWLPKQWYFMSRALLQKLVKSIVISENVAEVLGRLRYFAPELFVFWKDIFLEPEEDQQQGAWIASFGSLASGKTKLVISLL